MQRPYYLQDYFLLRSYWNKPFPPFGVGVSGSFEEEGEEDFNKVSGPYVTLP